MAPTQVFSCEYCEISKNAYFEEHLRTVVSPETTYVLVQLQILCYEQYGFYELPLFLKYFDVIRLTGIEIKSKF